MHRIDLPDWARQRGRLMNNFPHPEPSRTALIVIDMQNAFIREGQVFANPYAEAIIPAVNRLAGAVRQVGGLVVWTRQTVSEQPPMAVPPWQWDRSDPFVRQAMAALAAGGDGHALDDRLAIDEEEDLIVDKYRYSAFIEASSSLPGRLAAKGIDQLIIAGTLTNVCCESSARDAYMLGFKILFAADATAAVTDAEQNASLLNLSLNFADVRETADIAAMIGGSR